MTEFAASIIGIVSAGTKVSLVLYQLASDVGESAKEARMIAGEIRSFCSVVKTLGETLEKVQNSHYYAHCAEMTKDMTEASLEMFTEILNATEYIRNMSTGKNGKFGFVSRLQWAVFQKPKIAYLRAAIEAYKSNLTLMLGTLNTAEKVTRRLSHELTSGIHTRAEHAQLSTVENSGTQLQTETTEVQHGSVHPTGSQQEPGVTTEPEDRLALLQHLTSQQQESINAVEETYNEMRRQSQMGSENAGDVESLDTVENSNSLPGNTPSNSRESSLLGSVRAEIASIRSSLSRTPTFDSDILQQNLYRYSRSLSVLVSEDVRRMSQLGLPTSNPQGETSAESEGITLQKHDSPTHVASLEKRSSQDHSALPRLGRCQFVVNDAKTLFDAHCSCQRFQTSLSDVETLCTCGHQAWHHDPQSSNSLEDTTSSDDLSAAWPKPWSYGASPPRPLRERPIGNLQSQPAYATSLRASTANSGDSEVSSYETVRDWLMAKPMVARRVILDKLWDDVYGFARRPTQTELATVDGENTDVQTRWPLSKSLLSANDIIEVVKLQLQSFEIKCEAAAADGVAPPDLAIDLSSKALIKLSVEIIDLIKGNVERLSLSVNKLVVLPQQIALCKSLRYLNLRRNKLPEFPTPLLEISTLNILDLSHNLLKSIPETISQLHSLKIFLFHHNQVTSMPRAFAGMDSLRMLGFDDNPIVFPSYLLKGLKGVVVHNPLKAELPALERGFQEVPSIKEWFQKLAEPEPRKGHKRVDSPVPKARSPRFPVVPSGLTIPTFPPPKNYKRSSLDYWIPKAAPDGRLFYWNTLTGAETSELPIESPGPATTNNAVVQDPSNSTAESSDARSSDITFEFPAADDKSALPSSSDTSDPPPAALSPPGPLSARSLIDRRTLSVLAGGRSTQARRSDLGSARGDSKRQSMFLEPSFFDFIELPGQTKPKYKDSN